MHLTTLLVLALSASSQVAAYPTSERPNQSKEELVAVTPKQIGSPSSLGNPPFTHVNSDPQKRYAAQLYRRQATQGGKKPSPPGPPLSAGSVPSLTDGSTLSSGSDRGSSTGATRGTTPPLSPDESSDYGSTNANRASMPSSPSDVSSTGATRGSSPSESEGRGGNGGGFVEGGEEPQDETRDGGGPDGVNTKVVNHGGSRKFD